MNIAKLLRAPVLKQVCQRLLLTRETFKGIYVLVSTETAHGRLLLNLLVQFLRLVVNILININIANQCKYKQQF